MHSAFTQSGRYERKVSVPAAGPTEMRTANTSNAPSAFRYSPTRRLSSVPTPPLLITTTALTPHSRTALPIPASPPNNGYPLNRPVRATHTAKFDEPCEQDQSEKNVAPGRHRAVDGYNHEVAHWQNDQIREDGEPENHWLKNRIRGRPVGRTVYPLDGGRARVTHVHPLQSDSKSLLPTPESCTDPPPQPPDTPTRGRRRPSRAQSRPRWR